MTKSIIIPDIRNLSFTIEVDKPILHNYPEFSSMVDWLLTRTVATSSTFENVSFMGLFSDKQHKLAYGEEAIKELEILSNDGINFSVRMWTFSEKRIIAIGYIK